MPAYICIYIYMHLCMGVSLCLVPPVNKRLFTVTLTPSAKLVIS